MKLTRLVPLVLLSIQLGHAQMTLEQKLVDFQQLAGLFAKHYAFTEWKQQSVHFNSLNLAPWIGRINSSKDDLEFFEICMQYVAASQDAHTGFTLPSSFFATLGFTADLYDGKALIDFIDPKALDAAHFPAQVGDELVSIDGKAAADIIAAYVPFVNDGNARSARRTAATLVTVRVQTLIPRAHEIGDTATVVVRRQSGDLETYTLAWNKSGYPYTSAGPAPDPQASGSLRSRSTAAPAWRQLLQPIHHLRAQHTKMDVINASSLKPVFAPPDNFIPRLGNPSVDDFFTGTFTANGVRIGYLRYPAFDFFSSTALSREISYFQTNTDGLIIDVMGNPGGDTCTLEDFIANFMPAGYHSLGQTIRADWGFVMLYQDAVDGAIQDGSFTEDEIAQLKAQADAVRIAYSQNRGFTDPLPLCSLSQDVPTVTDTRTGRSIAYTKPIMVLTDELSYSAAEAFAAIMQDAGRALIYGMRTDGAGGSPGQFGVGVYMEAGAFLAQTQIVRAQQIKSPEYPAGPYIENIGVLPDKVGDYMTTQNLLQKGKPFVTDFTQAMVDYVNSKKQQ